MKYQTISKPCPKQLDKRVNELLQDGWTLHGGPNASHTHMGSPIYLQAMVYDLSPSVLKREEILAKLQNEGARK